MQNTGVGKQFDPGALGRIDDRFMLRKTLAYFAGGNQQHLVGTGERAVQR